MSPPQSEPGNSNESNDPPNISTPATEEEAKLAEESKPSKLTININIPLTKIEAIQFVYNYYVNDESTNQFQNVDINKKPTANLLARLPRYNKISLNNEFVNSQTNASEVAFALKQQQLKSKKLSENFNKIITQNNLDNLNFTGIVFQDTSFDSKLKNILNSSLSVKLATNLYQPGNTEVVQQKPEFDPNDASFLDVAQILNDLTTDSVDEHFITDSIMYNKVFDKIKAIGIDVQLNTLVVGDVITNVISDPLSIYTDELLLLQKQSIDSQQHAQQTNSTTTVNINDYYTVVDFIFLKFALDNEKFKNTVIGYIIEKYEIFDDGNLKRHDDIIVENANTKTAIDYNVKYGARYIYVPKTIASITFDAIDIETSNTYETEVYVTSHLAKKTIINCVETLPPPPPADFKITYDYFSQAPRLTWNFPINPQRDIKIFQIFRRTSVDVPFELIMQYDFNDGTKLYTSENGISTKNITYCSPTTSPRMYHLDYDFTKNSKYIYAIACVDAHGLTSGYSTQFEVDFDIHRNKIKTKLISTSGAPKQYPNIYLDEDTFIDVIKSTNYKKCHIYFDPDYLEVFDASTIKMGLMTTDKKDGKYILQIINTDNQKQQNVSITLNDKRTTK